jgi:hypothetical protein
VSFWKPDTICIAVGTRGRGIELNIKTRALHIKIGFMVRIARERGRGRRTGRKIIGHLDVGIEDRRCWRGGNSWSNGCTRD